MDQNSRYKARKILILFLGICFISAIWYHIDKHLFLTGKNTFAYKSPLPYGVRPVFRYSFEGGFSLMDRHGMPLLGNRSLVQTNGITDTISKILKYGLGNGRIFAYVETVDKNLLFLEILKDTHNEICNDCLITGVVAMDPKLMVQLKWYVVPSDSLSDLEVFRNILSLILGVLFILSIYFIGRYVFAQWSNQVYS
ncbi:hypothetical protein DBR32_09460 [Taibaiella sp. KBW10]|uniref:hypothetical protein n=1 Tax=Taibaiella sp. KBW10 TaxID=2153357 RepID=UPI000F5AA420|nr:hypothetical protein [Taibaiella sp. KBW10]RQO30928.1 hypothetical protein DBR32_09460 [Taibaiella sp. KBW10]